MNHFQPSKRVVSTYVKEQRSIGNTSRALQFCDCKGEGQIYLSKNENLAGLIGQDLLALPEKPATGGVFKTKIYLSKLQ